MQSLAYLLSLLFSVARFVQEVRAERVICLTATATPIVAEDICKGFSIAEDCVFRTSPYRPKYGP